MNRTLVALVGTALAALSLAAPAKEPAVDREIEVDARGAPDVSRYEEVARITMLTRPYSFDVIDDDSVIIWRTRRDPYLVELRFPSPDLRFAHAIGVTSSGSQVHARFDDLRVAGLRYPIDKIYRLSREDARRLAAHPG